MVVFAPKIASTRPDPRLVAESDSAVRSFCISDRGRRAHTVVGVDDHYRPSFDQSAETSPKRRPLARTELVTPCNGRARCEPRVATAGASQHIKLCCHGVATPTTVLALSEPSIPFHPPLHSSSSLGRCYTTFDRRQGLSRRFTPSHRSCRCSASRIPTPTQRAIRRRIRSPACIRGDTKLARFDSALRCSATARLDSGEHRSELGTEGPRRAGARDVGPTSAPPIGGPPASVAWRVRKTLKR